MAKNSKPERLFGRQVSKVAEQAEQDLGGRADPEKLAVRASAIAEEAFGVTHDFTADYFLKRRQKASDAEPQLNHVEVPEPPTRTRAGSTAESTSTRDDSEVTLSELRVLRSKLGEDGTDLETLAKLLPKVEGYVALVGELPRLRQAVEFLTGKD